MADDATRTSTTSLEDDDDQRYLDDAAWARREEGYRQQIKALEEQHKTLKNAWSDIVRTNLLKVDELKKELETKRAKRDSVRDALDAARSTGAATHDRLVAELCSAKVEVAELNERRDRARKKLGEEARTLWPTIARTNFLRAPRLTRSRVARSRGRGGRAHCTSWPRSR